LFFDNLLKPAPSARRHRLEILALLKYQLIDSKGTIGFVRPIYMPPAARPQCTIAARPQPLNLRPIPRSSAFICGQHGFPELATPRRHQAAMKIVGGPEFGRCPKYQPIDSKGKIWVRLSDFTCALPRALFHNYASSAATWFSVPPLV
jgi:hypothetical protein